MTSDALQRQSTLDKLLTEKVIKSIIDSKEVNEPMNKHLNSSEAKTKRVMVIVYGSMSSLLRVIEGESKEKGEEDKPLSVTFKTLTEAKQKYAEFETISKVDEESFCIIIGSLPTLTSYRGNGIIAHSFSAFRIK